jgi:hypothetical protein
MSIPKHYLAGLSKTDREIQKKAILKARKKYNKKEYFSRPKLESFKSRESRHITDFYKKYKIKISKETLPEIEEKTGVPQSALRKVIKKGEGAYYSSGSRPNQTAHSWAYARLASFLLGRGAYKIDKSVLDNVDKSKIKIKFPESPAGEIPNCCSKLITVGLCKTKKRKEPFKLPRKYSKEYCLNKKKSKKKMGSTEVASCTPFMECSR